MEPNKNPVPTYSRATALKEGLLVNVSEEAKQEGITAPVAMDASLIETLNPTPFLSSLGVTLKDRITNLLKLAHAHVTPGEPPEESAEQKTIIPFMLLQGPLVHEDFISVALFIEKGDDGKPAITLTRIREGDEDTE
jgi:hypothetical protein